MKKSQLKRAVSVALSILMLLAFLPAPTLAEDTEPTPNTYTVLFSVDGAIDASLTQIVEEGATASAPGDPAVPEDEEFTGMSFLYWYAGADSAYDFSTPVTADMTLYAKFGYTEEPESLDPPAALAAEATGSTVNIYIYGGNNYANLIQHYVMTEVTDAKILEYDGIDGIGLLHLLQTDTGYALAGTSAAIPSGDLYKNGQIDLEGGPGVYDVYVYIKTGAVKTTYTVYYKDTLGNTISPDKTVSELAVGDSVTEYAIDISGYALTSASPQTIVLAYSGNDFTFVYAASAYHITYVLNGGENSPLNPATYTVNSETITLADPVRDGYDFTGWLPTNTILSGSSGDKTFTATWTDANVYNITYVLNGGENSPLNPATYTVNSETITLADPTRTGYQFLGWLPTNTILSGSTGDKTFTATWSDAIVYSITYELNGGENDPSNPVSYTVESETITLADPVRDGYDFAGWLPTNTILSGSIGDKTFTATWTDANVYNITYVLNGGENSPLNPATYTVNSETITLADPTRAGYQFLGWSPTNTILSGSTGDITFTATWSDAIVYNITYELNGGENDPSNPVTYTVNSGTITLADPTRDGYIFDGWSPTDTILSGSTEDKTFTALWSGPVAYSITYVLGGGENSPLNPATYTVNSETITLADPTRAGYQFLGWSPTNTILSGSTGDITFTATWSDAIVYNITYELNGGENDPANPVTYTVNSGTIILADPTKAGYYFLGWTPTDTILSGSTEDKTFTANWAEQTALTLTANSAVYNYDAAVKSVSGITPSIAGLTIEGATAGASGIAPGVYQTNFQNQENLVILDGGEDVTERYAVSWVNGSLTVNPRVMYRADASGELLGTEWVAYGTGDATYSVTPPQNVSYNGVNYYWLGAYNPASAEDLTENTTIYALYAQNKPLVITADSASYPYDGSLHTITTGTVSDPAVTVSGYTVYGGGTYAGAYPTSVSIGPDFTILSGAEDVTYQYDVSTVKGTLTILPANTTADSQGYAGIYDGYPHAITVTPAQGGSMVRYSLTYSGDPADYTLTESPAETDFTPGTTVYFVVTNPNYNPVFGSEVIKIDKRTIALTTVSDSKPYDGTALTNPDWSYDAAGNDGFADGEGFTSAAADGTITNVGSIENGFAYTLNASTDPANYAFEITKGTLTVTAADTLTVNAADYSGKYDGLAHGVTASANVSAGTQIYYSADYSANPADYTLTASPTATHVSESKTVYFVAINGNYAPAFGSASITIAPRAILVSTFDANRVYDGTPLTQSGWGFGAASDGFAGGEGFAATNTTGTITNAGSVENGFDYTFSLATRSEDYSVSITPGTLTVTKRAVLVSALNAEKNYSTADPAFGYTYKTGTVNGTTYYAVLAGDLGSVTVSVLRTNTDNYVGIYPGVLAPGVAAAPDVLSNYTFLTAAADFTINPRVIYNTNTVAAVTGFPQTEWFGYGTNAVVADGYGVVRAGYELTGWRDAATGNPVALGGTIPSIGSNYTLNAVWTREVYDETYDVDYDAGTDAAVLYLPAARTNILSGALITISGVVPYNSGYSFLHWSTTDIGGTARTFDPGDTFTMPDNDVTLTAVWEATVSPVNYHPNGAEGVMFEEGRYPTDADVTVAENTFTRTGYRFTGWSETVAATDVTRQPGDVVTMPPRQLNFYAQWEKELFTVTFIVSGGTGEFDGNETYITYTGLSYGDALPVPTDPALEGFVFEGWTTDIPLTIPDGDLVIYGTMSKVVADIEEEPEIIAAERTPLFGGSAWAIVNLILAAATALASLWVFFGLIGRKKDVEDGVVTPETQKRQLIARILTLLPAVGGVVAFLLTENMNNPMTLTDRWTIYMAAIAFVQFLLVVIGTTKSRSKDKNRKQEKPWTYDILKGV